MGGGGGGGTQKEEKRHTFKISFYGGGQREAEEG